MKASTDKLRQARLKALAKVAIKQTDQEDMTNCVNDLQRAANLSREEAAVVAQAFRSSNLPRIAAASGLDESEISELLGMGEDSSTGFAKDFKNDEEEVEDIDEDGSDPLENDETPLTELDDVNDPSEAETPEDMVTFEIAVPRNKIDEAKEAIDEALSLVVNELSSDEPTDEILPEAPEGDLLETDVDGDGDLEDVIPHFASNNTHKVKAMDTNMQARKAQRENVLAKLGSKRRVVAEDSAKPRDVKHGVDTSWNASGPFSYNEGAQPKGEQAYPTMTMKGSDGNSLREDNPTFPKVTVPTQNPSHLQLGDSYETGSAFSEKAAPRSSESPLEFEIAFDEQKVPSSDPDRGDGPSIPTQMDLRKNKSTVAGTKGVRISEAMAQDQAKAEDYVYEALVTAGFSEEKIAGMPFSEGVRLALNLASAKKEESDSEVEITVSEDEKSQDKTASSHLEIARIKAAYDVTSKLAMSGVMTPDDASSQADKWIRDGLTVTSMFDIGKMILASSTRQAKAAASVSTRTASAPGLSVNPGLMNTEAPVWASGTDELKESLSNLFTRADRQHLNPDFASEQKR